MFGTSGEFANCIRQRKEYQSYQALHEKPFFIVQFFVRIHLNSVCTVHTLNAYSGAAAALAGIVVAAFTGTLWWSTEKMWSSAQHQLAVDKDAREVEAGRFAETLAVSRQNSDAAKRAADAAMGIELPLIRVAMPEIFFRAEIGNEKIQVRLILQNFGRNNAYMLEWAGTVCESVFLPADPSYALNAIKRADIGEVISAGDRCEMKFPDGASIEGASAAKIWNRESTFWVHGYVAYRDFLDACWRSKFCLKLDWDRKGSYSLVEDYSYQNYWGREQYDPAKANPYRDDPLAN